MGRTVYGTGDITSKLWLIGEAPGKNEDIQGRPFVGGAGMVLDGILTSVGLDRSKLYIDNVVRVRPPKNNFGVYYHDKSRRKPKAGLIEWHWKIQELVKEHQPNVVVALGNEALYALTGKKKIMLWRGSILSALGTKVVPTIHPAMVMRRYELRPVAVCDFERAKEQSLTSNPPPAYNDNFIINPSFDEVMKTLDSLHNKPYLTFDIETGNNQILCLGLGWSKTEAICIPIFYSTSSWWSLEEELAIIKKIKEIAFSIKNF